MCIICRTCAEFYWKLATIWNWIHFGWQSGNFSCVPSDTLIVTH